MTICNKDQMIDQLDVDRAQEKRRRRGGFGIGGARAGVAGGMIVRHDHGDDAAADQAAPATRRNGAAVGALTARAFEADEPIERIEAGEQQRFAIGGKMRPQQVTRQIILGCAGDVARKLAGFGRRVDGGEVRHWGDDAPQFTGRQPVTAPQWTLMGASPARPLFGWRLRPSNGWDIRE